MESKQPQTIVCENCSQEFVWTVGEQEFYAEKGLEKPKFCVICRSIKKAEADQFGQFIKSVQNDED